jgi:hypothetical protein
MNGGSKKVFEEILSYYLILEPTNKWWKALLEASALLAPSEDDADPTLSMICAGNWNDNELRCIFESYIAAEACQSFMFLHMTFHFFWNETLAPAMICSTSPI